MDTLIAILAVAQHVYILFLSISNPISKLLADMNPLPKNKVYSGNDFGHDTPAGNQVKTPCSKKDLLLFLI